MIINWYGEGCFKIQTSGVTILTDLFESKRGLTPPRFKADIVISTEGKPASFPAPANLISVPGEYEVKGIKIVGFPPAIFLLEAEDLKLGFLGHLLKDPGPAIAEEFGGVDLLFVPSGGKPFVDQKIAAQLVRQIGPKIVIPCFFKISGLKRPAADIKDFAKELGQKVEPQEKLVIKKKDLLEVEGPKLVCLKI